MKNKKALSGQSLIEFVFIFPIAIFLITGFLDLGRAVFYYSSLTNAVREATRSAIVMDLADNNINQSIIDQVKSYSFGLNEALIEINDDDIDIQKDSRNKFSTVSVTARYKFNPVTPFIARLLGGSDYIELVVQSQMRVSPISY